MRAITLIIGDEKGLRSSVYEDREILDLNSRTAIRARRRKVQATQGLLAKMVGVSTTTIHNIEVGKTQPSQDIFAKINTALDVLERMAPRET